MESMTTPNDSNRISEREVLLVEDNLLNQMVAEKFLQDIGFTVSVAGSGITALKLMEQKEFAFVLMDLQLPGMDGYETTRAVRQMKKYREIPIIAMTAHDINGEEEKCKQAGINDFVSKPINSDVLKEKINRLLNLKIK